MKPRIFIGSSVENLDLAEAVQSNLEHTAFPEIWTQDIFQLSMTTIESLFSILQSSDFAIFILSPDDIIKIRDTEKPVVRDNVIFELGLFMGKLGRDKVFYLIPRNQDVHLPTDLLGITPGTYDAEHPNISASIGPFVRQVKQRINTLFSPDFPNSNLLGNNILNDSITMLEPNLNYSLEAHTPNQFPLKIKIRNLSKVDGMQNIWLLSVGQSDGWINETYDFDSNHQVFILGENKKGIRQIQFQGEGEAEVEFYKGDELFNSKKIYWGNK
ncbi:TIR domain-containing protein [Ancylomarina longa]|uniref:CD-NTase-associated protein 12/Pycsar effector protein TIR domain-containing protein n=1 Tax=Ancylomarina longa TaxID=2487017 RepID=A0A434AVW4_9BACT|nr:nucleotide-binding protein [Ancylomarina longa]RUT78514.1 hypothetical protein DLK05_08030 [Ancylomarina longa]